MEPSYIEKVMNFSRFVDNSADKLAGDFHRVKDDKPRRKLVLDKLVLVRTELNKLESEIKSGQFQKVTNLGENPMLP